MHTILLREYVLLQRDSRVKKGWETLLSFFHHFKPRKVSINDGGSKSLIFILPTET